MNRISDNKAVKHSIRPLQMAFATLLALLMFSACASIDCPLNNTVRLKMVMKGEVDTLKDTLTITAIIDESHDTILYYKGVNVTNVSVPMSYSRPVDRYGFTVTTADNITTYDVVEITKTNEPVFTSVECSPSFYHTLTDASTTTNRMEKVTINHPNVTTDATQEHLYLYFRP